ncbi:ATP-binding protein [Streptomyces sp. NPDC053367]|uniref:ATP-binding protein n=1 Tax=Streptomyces sp. NPDC053367 TaxID=3365700 RepID=UPI0037D80A90
MNEKPIDLTHWQPILEAHNLDPDLINSDPATWVGEPGYHARRGILTADAGIPFIYRTALPTLPEVKAWADSYLDANQNLNSKSTPRHRSLLLLGSTGVGKTHQAYGVLRYLAAADVFTSWATTSAADMYAALRPRHGVDSETEFRKYAHAQLLMIDDLGAAKPSEWTEEINFRLVNHRYENRLPTIITSNVLPKELTERVGERVASRLVGMSDRVVLRGEDRRRQAAA